MINLSETDTAVTWLKQFNVDDQATAVALIDTIRLVSRDEFFDRLRALILERAGRVDGPIGLYAEREIRKNRGIPNRLFKEKGGRAAGVGPQPVQPTHGYDPQVGSEGLIAWLITELCREQPGQFFNHPGPDQIRRKKVRAFFLITDFIGSGMRVCSYLQAAWRAASVKSWCSLHLFRFEVVAYSAADDGRTLVEAHRSRPMVSLVIPCPTIKSEFNRLTADRMRSLCIHYDPIGHNPVEALGFGGAGVLLAFAHGCPNNAPRILHKKSTRWKPLFPARVTASSRALFGDRHDENTLASRLARMREQRLARGQWLSQTSREGHAIILLLAALRRGPRFDEAIARKTGLTIPEVRMLIKQASDWGWIAENRHLTGAGHSQLANARRIKKVSRELPSEPKELYYPKSLRAPRNASS